MSFNNFLLSKLTKSLNKGADVFSLIQRYQDLWTIYCNFVCIFGLLTWKLINQVLSPETGDNAIVISYPLILISLIFLKRGQDEISAALALITLHIANYVSGQYSCIGAANFLVLMPGLGFLMSSSPRFHKMNVVGCLLQNAIHMYRMEQKFKSTFTEEQRAEILQVHIISFISLTSVTVLFYIQNSAKNNLWQLAHTNFVKTEEIAKELVLSAKAKDIFVSSLSHEIRNPLNCMKGSIDYLLQNIKNPDHLQLLRNAKMSGEVLLNLLSNVLDAAKLKSEKMELFYTETNITETIKKALILFSENLRDKKIKVPVYVDRTLPVLMKTDPSRILQIIINLFSNAFKFTPENGKIRLYLSWYSAEQNKQDLLKPIEKIPRREDELNNQSLLVGQQTGSNNNLDGTFEAATMEEFPLLTENLRLGNLRFLSEPVIQSSTNIFLCDSQKKKRFLAYNAERYIATNTLETIFSDLPPTANRMFKKGFLKIQISDTGCGINKENIPKLFEMFSQADNVTSSAHTGSGLGLWICKQLCNKMGGDIALYSTLGIGTTFVLYIPIDNDSLSLASQLRPKRAQECLRALVVDDYPYNRDMHKLILEREGVQVSLASDGKQAVEMFTGHDEDYFQFVMMDVKMPVMDGFTAARKIREWETERGRKKVDIYFVSGEYYNEEEVMRELKKEGGMDEMEGIKCLQKPIDVERVKQLLQKFKEGGSDNVQVDEEK